MGLLDLMCSVTGQQGTNSIATFKSQYELLGIVTEGCIIVSRDMRGTCQGYRRLVFRWSVDSHGTHANKKGHPSSRLKTQGVLEAYPEGEHHSQMIP